MSSAVMHRWIFTSWLGHTVTNGNPWRGGNLAVTSKGQNAMKIDTYDSPKLDILKDDILGLIHDVDDYKERIPEICTVLRNVQDTLAPGWFRNEVRKREDVAIKVYAAVSPAEYPPPNAR